jgi:tetratricopeptide (TPR) repeat protein
MVPPRLVLRILLVTCLAVMGDMASGAQRGGWDPTLLEQWVTVVETHVPGSVDAPLGQAAAWEANDLRKLWNDVHVLLVITTAPRTTALIIPPLSFEPQVRSSRDQRTVSFRKDERKALEALAARVRARGLNETAHRAAMLHTDIVTVASSIATPSSTASGAQTRWTIGDGTGMRGGQSLHWELARAVLTYVQPDPRRDFFVRDWYRATVANAQAIEYFDTVQLGNGLRLFPDDPELLLLAGAEREAMATPLFQAFAKSLSRTALLSGISSEDDELGSAAAFYRRALSVSPDFAEARLRLGRVLGLQGRHADALEELRRASPGSLDRMHQYFALLFLGQALEGAGNTAEALDAFEQAAGLVPDARTPYLAIARLARERGDRARTQTSLERALAPIDIDDTIDPLWMYRSTPGRRRVSMLDDVRARAGANRP